MKKILSLLILAATAAAIIKVLQDDAAAEASRVAAVKERAKKAGRAANPRAGITEALDEAIGLAAADVAAATEDSGDADSGESA